MIKASKPAALTPSEIERLVQIATEMRNRLNQIAELEITLKALEQEQQEHEGALARLEAGDFDPDKLKGAALNSAITSARAVLATGKARLAQVERKIKEVESSIGFGEAINLLMTSNERAKVEAVEHFDAVMTELLDESYLWIFNKLTEGRFTLLPKAKLVVGAAKQAGEIAYLRHYKNTAAQSLAVLEGIIATEKANATAETTATAATTEAPE